MKILLKIGLGLLICFGLFFLFLKGKMDNMPNIDFGEIHATTLSGDPYHFEPSVDKPKVVNIWATWCAPCIKEFPAFQELKTQYDDEIDFLMISDESANKVEAFADKNTFDFNYLITEQKLLVRPVTYFMDKRGNIVKRLTGGASKGTLEKHIKKLL